jgi:hypothetical protein
LGLNFFGGKFKKISRGDNFPQKYLKIGKRNERNIEREKERKSEIKRHTNTYKLLLFSEISSKY